MNITETRIPAVKLIEPKVFGDERGFFMETWNDPTLKVNWGVTNPEGLLLSGKDQDGQSLKQAMTELTESCAE